MFKLRHSTKAVEVPVPDVSALTEDDRLWLLKQDVRAGVVSVEDRAGQLMRQFRDDVDSGR